MAKRKTSTKQRDAARRNIKKAQAAKAAKKLARSKAARKAARSRTKSPRRAARKSTRRAKAKAAPRKRSKSRSKSKRRSSKRGKRRSRKTRRSMSMRVPRKTKKVYVVAAEKPRRRKRRKSRRHHAAEKPRRHRRSSRRRGAMENPMTGVELFVGSITGLFGFGVADAVDRLLATHALTDKGAKDANGYELYADNPPTSGDYTGLFNATAVCAPMDWKRWVFGLLGTAVPLGVAHFVSAPTGRSALQFFGFGYGVRIVGKGLIDGIAALSSHTAIGQQLYDGEMRAAVLKANNGNSQAQDLASLPSAGLGSAKALPCKNCPPATQGAGYPSMPREVAPAQQPTQMTQSPAPQPPPPPPAAPLPPAYNPGPLTGLPKNGVAAKKNPYTWGSDSPDYKD